MTLTIHAGAWRDYNAGFDYLADRAPRSAAAFVAARAAIEADPARYPAAEDGPPGADARYFYIRKFHYRVVYARRGGDIVVLAVAHASRAPGYWLGRLPNP